MHRRDRRRTRAGRLLRERTRWRAPVVDLDKLDVVSLLVEMDWSLFWGADVDSALSPCTPSKDVFVLEVELP